MHALTRPPAAALRQRRRRRAATGYDYPITTAGSTANVIVLVATSLGAPGLATAQAVLAAAEDDFQRVQALFGATAKLPPCTVIVAPLSGTHDGTGGAYHYGCADTTLYCDCDFQRPERTRALFAAELSEVGQAVQAAGWDCGAAHGEGLSRVHAEVLFPGALDDYETASTWLDGSRPNAVDISVASDQDPEANGCAVLFLHWLHALGYGYDQITQAAAATLAGVYGRLQGQAFLATAGPQAAWVGFSAAVESHWPAGIPSGVTTDDPWAGVPGPAPAPAPPPVPTPSPLTLTIPVPIPAGTYALTIKEPKSAWSPRRSARMPPPDSSARRTAVPTPLNVRQVLDQLFADLEARAQRPFMRFALATVQALADGWLEAHGY